MEKNQAPAPEKTESKDPEPEHVCAIYDGTIESAVMIHKVVREGLKVTLLEDKVKFGKLNLESQQIKGIGEQNDRNKILDYIKESAKYCLSKGIKKLYIGWTSENMMRDHSFFQNIMTVGVPQVLTELNGDEKDGKFVRAIFYNHAHSNEWIEKNKKQYGLE